jgi:pimeloyl-ACP methyl ester carboxylesterase
METYFRYDLEKVGKGVRSRIKAAHIREEMANKRQAGAAPFYPRLRCPVLILRATQGILRADDILLPDEVVNGMLAEIPDASCVDIEGTHHYSILFQPHVRRDEEIDRFLTQTR